MSFVEFSLGLRPPMRKLPAISSTFPYIIPSKQSQITTGFVLGVFVQLTQKNYSMRLPDK
jgi:hypothetical protein